MSQSVFRRALLPAGVFVLVWVAHYIWLGVFPDQPPAQDQWVPVDDVIGVSWWQRYVETQSYYMGFSYACALAFAGVALRRYRETRLGGARTLAVGGVSLSGALAVAGCYLLGCCGSPMIAVYMSLFGAAFIPWARPLVALFTVLCISVAWWRMNRAAAACTACDAQAAPRLA